MKEALDLLVKIYKRVMDYTCTIHFKNTAWFAAKASHSWVSVCCKARCNSVENKAELLRVIWGQKKTYIIILQKGKSTDCFKNWPQRYKVSVWTGVTHCLWCCLHPFYFTALSRRSTPLSFLPLMWAFCGVSFLLRLCSGGAVWINSDTSEETGNPCGSLRGRACKTPLERSSVHPRVITKLWSEYIMLVLPRWKASGDVCAFYSAVHVHQCNALHSSLHSSSFKQASQVVTLSQSATLLTPSGVHNYILTLDRVVGTKKRLEDWRFDFASYDSVG